MTEVKREEILAGRMEERQKFEERREVARLVAGGPEGVAKAAKSECHTFLVRLGWRFSNHFPKDNIHVAE